MDCFKQNSCRLCEQVFCCVECRLSHEKATHFIYPECDICIYGNIRLGNFSKELLEHIEKTHWPLHCVRCKHFFGTMDEIINHNKCSGYPSNNRNQNNLSNNKVFGTFPKLSAEVKYESPSVSFTNQEFTGILPNAATSTPTSREELDDKENDKVIIITPATPAEKSILVKAGLTPNDFKKNESSLKRKVTFSETPVMESSRRKKLLTGQKSESIEEEDIVSKPEAESAPDTSKKEENNRGDGFKLSVSPLGRSLSAGSNEQFYAIMVTATATSTPMSIKDDKLLEQIELQNLDQDGASSTNKTPEDVKPKEEQIKFITDYQTPLTSGLDKYRHASGFHNAGKKIQSKEENDDADTVSDDTSTQFFSVKQTPSINTWVIGKATEEDENMHNELMKDKEKNILIEETLWLSAINNLGTSEETGGVETQAMDQKEGDEGNNERVSVEVKKVVCLPEISTINQDSLADVSLKSNTSKNRLWNSMTQVIKSVVTGLSSIKSGSENNSSKRLWTDNEEEEDDGPELKKMKITDIKCRRTIRAICPLKHSGTKIMVDKATQTD